VEVRLAPDAGSVTRRRLLTLVAAAGAAATALTGCGGAQRAFVVDDHVRITAPAPLAVVSTPFTVRWTAGRSDDRYAVFVDRDPMAAGHSLRDLADDQCKQVRGCPDESYFANRGVFVTSRSQVEIPLLPILKGTGARARHPRHTITVITIDDHGRRSSDGSWQVEVRS
jgi:hypothetical protein